MTSLSFSSIPATYQRSCVVWWVQVGITKTGIPKLYYLVPIGFVCVFLLFGFAYYYMKSSAPEEKRPEPTREIPASEPFKGAYRENTKNGSLSTEDYILSFKPRLNGFPHSAPRYDEITKPVTAPYPAACIKMENKGCQCYSQQGTRIMMDEATCENIVKEGFFIDWDKEPQRNNERETV